MKEGVTRCTQIDSTEFKLEKEWDMGQFGDGSGNEAIYVIVNRGLLLSCEDEYERGKMNFLKISTKRKMGCAKKYRSMMNKVATCLTLQNENVWNSCFEEEKYDGFCLEMKLGTRGRGDSQIRKGVRKEK